MRAPMTTLGAPNHGAMLLRRRRGGAAQAALDRAFASVSAGVLYRFDRPLTKPKPTPPAAAPPNPLNKGES
jgi:hypothetical protein